MISYICIYIYLWWWWWLILILVKNKIISYVNIPLNRFQPYPSRDAVNDLNGDDDGTDDVTLDILDASNRLAFNIISNRFDDDIDILLYY